MFHPAHESNGNGTRPKRLEQLYEEQLADIRAAERQAARVLPDMAVVAADEDIASVLRATGAEAEVQLARIEQLVDLLGVDTSRMEGVSLNGFLAEARSVLAGDLPGDADDVDGALLRSARQALCYQIAGYESACATARRLGDYRTLDTLLQSLDEELATDASLSRLVSRRSRMLRAL